MLARESPVQHRQHAPSQVCIVLEQHESVRAEGSRPRNPVDDLVRARQPVRADPDAERDPTPHPVHLSCDDLLQSLDARGVVHGTHEVEVPPFDPELPVLADRISIPRPVGEYGRGDLDVRLDPPDLLAHRAYEARDLVLPPLLKRLDLVSGKHVLRPTGHLDPGILLKSVPASFTITRVFVGIPDVVKMDPIHIILADHFQHRVPLQPEVLRMGGTEPFQLVPVTIPLKPSLRAKLRDELLRSGGEIVVHLPGMHFHAVFSAPLHTFRERIALLARTVRHRQDLTLVVRQTGPQYIREDRVEPVFPERHDGPFPSPISDPVGDVDPDPPKLAPLRRLCGRVGLRRSPSGLHSEFHCLRIARAFDAGPGLLLPPSHRAQTFTRVPSVR